MQSWILMCWMLSALACAEQDCPNGDTCADGHTCCSSPENGYNCCPFDQAECCPDHAHCCPGGTLCDQDALSCVNDTISVPWVDATPAVLPTLSKSFRMVRSYDTDDNDNVCPDESRCPPEYSCLRALTRFSCCPLAQGISCDDGKHCCPEGHRCSPDSRSCIRKEAVLAVDCGDGESECPEETTCCGNSDGSWGCCPITGGVCCEDMAHCCPAGSACDVNECKCMSLTSGKEMLMWAKLPARKIAAWERVTQDGDQETVSSVSGEEDSETTTQINTTTEITSEWTLTAPLEDVTELSTSEITTTGKDTPCNQTACLDGDTCCKKTDISWGCCPLDQAVCCVDMIHCCPHGKRCNLMDHTCDWGSSSMPWVETSVMALAVKPSGGAEAMAKEVEQNEATFTTLPTTTTITTVAASIQRPAEEVVEAGPVQCDPVTFCPVHTTCCFRTLWQKWGCCPIPKAVCCAEEEYCCPTNYMCDESTKTCYKGEVSIPWYTKFPAVEAGSMLSPNSVACDTESRCPMHFTCCTLSPDQWGCCPLYEAVCCGDKEHCCPWGYSCIHQTASCQPLTWIPPVPFTRVVLPQREGEGDLSQGQRGAHVTHCQGTSFCKGGETCCRILPNAWACCPNSNAVCCGDMRHCCPAGHTCHAGLTCTPNAAMSWNSWHVFLSKVKKGAEIL